MHRGCGETSCVKSSSVMASAPASALSSSTGRRDPGSSRRRTPAISRRRLRAEGCMRSAWAPAASGLDTCSSPSRYCSGRSRDAGEAARVRAWRLVVDMARETGDDARTLEQRALQVLDKPETASPTQRVGRSLLRVWHYNSRSDHRAWLLWTGRGPQDTLLRVRRVVWTRPSSVTGAREVARQNEGGTAAALRLSVADADVPHEPWQQLLAEAEGLLLPAFCFGDFTVGTDGSVHGVEQKSFRRTLRFEWWWKPPKGWEELADWVARATDLFEASLGTTDVGGER